MVSDGMSVLSVLVDVLGPVVAVAALGSLFGSRLGIEARQLSRLAYWVLGPAFMFDLLHDAELAGDIVLGLTVSGLVGMAAGAGAAALAVGVVPGQRRYETMAAAALTGSYGNVGNAGLAVSAFALGDELLPAAGVFILVINTTGMMFGVALAHGRRGSLSAALGQALIAPMTVASLAAIAFNVLDLSLPTIGDRSVGLVAGALIPVMLFTLGVQLRAGTELRFGVTTAAATIGKLIIAPAAAAACGWAIGLTGDYLSVTVIQSAMPPAVFCMVLALEHDLEPEEVTATVVAVTLASLITLPVVLTATIG